MANTSIYNAFDRMWSHVVAKVGEISEGIQTQLNSKVPTSRTINGKPLSSDITLSASDLNIYVQSTEPTGAATGAIWVDTTV